MRRSVAIWAVMLGGLLTSSVQGTAPVPPAEQDATRAVRGEFRNPVTPSSTWSTPTLFSGNLNGAVGTPVNPASTPNDGTRYLIRSRIGHPVGGGAPFANFVANSIDHGRKLLYYGEADNIPPGSDNPAAGQYSRELAAYRYKDLMYGEVQSGSCLANPEIACLISDECPTGDTCGTQVSYVANLLEARIGNGLMTMEDFYGPAERARSEEAERALRNALKYSPLSTSLRNELLDVYYDRTVAELSLAKANRIDAFKERILAPPVLRCWIKRSSDSRRHWGPSLRREGSASH